MSELITFSAGGVRWRVAADCRELLFGPDGLRLDEWLAQRQARVVKQGPHCTVYRVTLPDVDFHVKHYRLFNARAWLRQMIRPAKARSEFERGLVVIARDVPTAAPLGVGEHATLPGDSFLITRSLVDSEPLGAFIETTLPELAPARQHRIRHGLASALGKMLARMHAGGVVHHDLHAGNLLVRLGADDHPELYLIDLHAVRVGRPLTWQARRENLVMLNRWFVLRSDRGDRLRFWRAYVQAWQGEPETLKHREFSRNLAHTLEAATWESNLQFWSNRDRRCRVANRYYQPVRAATASGYAVRGLDPAALARLLRDPDAAFDQPESVLIKDSPSSTVAVVDVIVDGVKKRAIFKRFRITSWSDPLAALFRPTGAVRSWVFGHGLRERGLPTPRPLLVLHWRRRGLHHEGYLLTEQVPDALDLRTYLDSLMALSDAERRPILRRLLARLARLIFELHRRNLSQRDLKATNLLLAPGRCPWSAVRESDTEGPHFWLIDLVGITHHAGLTRKRRVQNLARLHASFHEHPALTRTDRLRFLAVYLKWGLTGKLGWKRWWSEVHQQTQEKIARNRRSGRPLA